MPQFEETTMDVKLIDIGFGECVRSSNEEFRTVEWEVIDMAEKGMCDYPMKKGDKMMKPEPGESKSYEAKEEKTMKKMMSKPKKGGK